MGPLAWLAFLAAAAAGAVLRYAIDCLVGDRVRGVFPLGTFIINATGSLLLGLLTGLTLYHAFPRTPEVVLGTGFCGAYTTFSTFSFETVRLVEQGAIATALRNALASLVTCAGAAAIGLVLAAR